MRSILKHIQLQLSIIRSDVEFLKQLAIQEEPPIDLTEASEFLGISKAGIRYLISKDRIPYHLPSKTRKYRFFKSELIVWIKENKTPPPQG